MISTLVVFVGSLLVGLLVGWLVVQYQQGQYFRQVQERLDCGRPKLQVPYTPEEIERWR